MKYRTFDKAPAGKWARPSHPPVTGRLLIGSLRSKVGMRTEQLMSSL